MRKRTLLVARLAVMLVMALGLGTLMTSPAAAQTTTGACQVTLPSGQIQQGTCTVVVTGNGVCQVTTPDGDVLQNVGCTPAGCPNQTILSDGTILQFTCGVAATATNVPATATNVPATATTAPATATHVPATQVPATNVPGQPTATTAPATNVPATNVPATQAPERPDEEEPVGELPDTGQGSSSGQSSTANILMLGAMGMVLTLAAVALRVRGNR